MLRHCLDAADPEYAAIFPAEFFPVIAFIITSRPKKAISPPDDGVYSERPFYRASRLPDTAGERGLRHDAANTASAA